MALAPKHYVSINEAAAALGVKPWEVVRLIEAGQIQTVELVDAASLAQVKENAL